MAPQIRIPLGKKTEAPAPGEKRRLLNRGNAPTGGGIDDAAARCESQADPQSRAQCRDKLAREAKTP